MLELLAATFAIGTIAAFLGVTRHRGSGLANAGAVIGIPGCIGMVLIAAHRLFIYALVSSHTPNPLQALDQVDAAVGPIPILFFAMPVAMLLFAGAAVRARIAPPATLVLAALFFVLDFIPALPEHEILQLGIGLLAFGWIALRITQLTEPIPASTLANQHSMIN
jgi:hypothetical protein